MNPSSIELNHRLTELSSSLILVIASKARALKEAGVDVCGFGIGEPDFDTPPHIQEAAYAAMKAGYTKYTTSSGIPALREAISEKFRKDNQLDYKPGQVIVSTGAKQCCVTTIMAACNEGEEVIIPSPYWVTYPEMVRIANAVPVFVRTTQENAWKITPEQFEDAITPRTKLIIINTPGNPTGSVYTKDELHAIYEVAAAHNVLILSDEIYEKLVYEDAKHFSVASLCPEAYDLTITVNGFSKAYSMTGWRLGYMGAPQRIATVVDSIQSHMTANACAFAQMGGLAALQGDQQCVEDMRIEFDRRRKFMFERISSIRGTKAVKPFGAFYILMDIQSYGLSSEEFSGRLLTEANVVVAPGIAFGDDSVVRLSYAAGMPMIEKGLDRIEAFCAKL